MTTYIGRVKVPGGGWVDAECERGSRCRRCGGQLVLPSSVVNGQRICYLCSEIVAQQRHEDGAWG